MHSLTKHVVATAVLAVATGLLCNGCGIVRKLGETSGNAPTQQPARETTAPLPEPDVAPREVALEPWIHEPIVP